ncbi:MAG: hypothetical protein RIR62_3063 [Pseudomonadota bacterium]|jgi:hypothetical protein
MTFQPVLIGTGLAGWAALKRSAPAQQARLEASPEMARDAAYFRERIGSIATADQLVADRRLLRISLEAFGLEGDLNARALIRKVLEEGTLRPDSFANRLADKRYARLSAAFGFGDFSTPRTRLSTFADEILKQRGVQRFEAAVGTRDTNLRLALDAERGLAELARGRGSETTKWFNLMGSPPLRRVVETALGLPSSVATLDLDRQLSIFRDRAAAQWGGDAVSRLADPTLREDVIRRFLLRATAESAAPAAPALTLLSNVMFRRL